MTANDSGAACGDVEDLAAELALGIVSGSERGEAVAHLDHCPSCRRLVDELSTVADPLLLLAPEAEPSIGFESRVLAAISTADASRSGATTVTATRPDPVAAPEPASAPALPAGTSTGARSHRRRPVTGRRFRIATAALAAAALLVAATGGLVAGRLLDKGEPSVLTAVAVSGLSTCRALAYPTGKTAWVFVSFEAPQEWVADYSVEITTTGGGTPAAMGHLHLQDGSGALGTIVDVPASHLRAVRVLDASGQLRYEAPFRTT